MSIVLNGTTGITTPAATIANGFYLKGITYLTTGTAATYTTPSGVRALYVEVVGGGGGGGGVDGNGTDGASGAGGSGAGYCAKLITSPSATYTYTIGAGGSGGAAGSNPGTVGGSSTFSDGVVTLTANGGNEGAGQIAAASNTYYQGSPGAGASGGDINISGGNGGGRGRGDFAQYVGGSGGSSVLGKGAFGLNSANTATNGSAATEYGGGGAGASVEDSTADRAGGDGYQGVIRITEYY